MPSVQSRSWELLPAQYPVDLSIMRALQGNGWKIHMKLCLHYFLFVPGSWPGAPCCSIWSCCWPNQTTCLVYIFFLNTSTSFFFLSDQASWWNMFCLTVSVTRQVSCFWRHFFFSQAHIHCTRPFVMLLACLYQEVKEQEHDFVWSGKEKQQLVCGCFVVGAASL